MTRPLLPLLALLASACAYLPPLREPTEEEASAIRAARTVLPAECPQLDRTRIADLTSEEMRGWCGSEAVGCYVEANPTVASPVTSLLYIDVAMTGEDRAYVVAHEAMHGLLGCRDGSFDRDHTNRYVWVSLMNEAMVLWRDGI